MRNIVKYAAGLALVLVSSLCADSLRVLPVMRFRHNQTSKKPFVEIMMPLLKKKGIAFVSANPDLVVICGRVEKEVCEKFSQYPVVILDEEESASLHPVTRDCLKLPFVKAVYKNTVLRQKEKYNAPSVDVNDLGNNSYHFKIISDICKKLPSKNLTILTDQELQKIRCLLWDTYRSSLKADLKALKDEVIDFNQDKPVDVFFACKMWSDRMPGLHRKKALEQLKKIQGYNSIIIGGTIPKDEYLKLLKNSKIIVSPWGFGEWCWRDYEAVYSGAVLIKPDTSFVAAVPDLYQNDIYYVACRPDFSDVEEKISLVLNNYSKFTEMRKAAKLLLVNNWDYEAHAKKLAQELKKVFNEHKNQKERK